MERMRIHVGGLTGNVMPSDVEKTFSSLGKVSGVEFLSRPEGRSFAYMDFEPYSDKSLAKLFATYNGCIWKGGRLKLEKAKEHYMDRLRREWAEAAEITRNVHDEACGKKESKTSEKTKKLPQEKMHLKFFFPKLNKLKMLPYKGTGKHKYSFQRIEVPSFPIHFCDCEEHCKLSAVARDKNLASSHLIGGLGKKELNVMNSVIKKLFEKERHEKETDEVISVATEVDNSEFSLKDTQFLEKEEAEETDENFVMNIGLQQSMNMMDFFEAKGWDDFTGNQDGKGQTSTSGLIWSEEESQKRRKIGTNSPLVSVSKKMTGVSQSQSNSNQIEAFGKKRISEIPLQELQDSSRDNKDQNLVSNQSTRMRKSSWKKLVEDAKVGEFSISHLLSGSDSVKRKLSNLCDSSASGKTKKVKNQSDAGHTKNLEIEDVQTGTAFDDSSHEETSNGDHATSDKCDDKQGISVGDESDGNTMHNTQEEISSVTTNKTVISEAVLQELPVFPKASREQCQINQNLATQSTRGSSWLQKSSWTQLVSDAKSNSFSISQLLPDVDLLKRKMPEPCNSCTPTKDEKGTIQSVGSNGDKETLKIDGDITNKSEENQGPLVGKTCDKNSNRSTTSIDIGEACTFMRSADSLKQWAKARATVKGNLKKISNEDGTKGSKERWSWNRN